MEKLQKPHPNCMMATPIADENKVIHGFELRTRIENYNWNIAPVRDKNKKFKKFKKN